ncbi:hypothetical protein JOC28_000743 [Streptococcus loxodontisalivarius]|uniref:Bacterial Pleckstrin homology domain-containing protein n=1 Tax=Streptococcus loxodontisalivarius TaxID=1349415 RepID=A0ABS2PR94_9STRE|nr:hypothetical protein [Streptococcus loxodontisalivarius]
MAFGLDKLAQGLAGNFNKQDKDKLGKEYEAYLIEGEEITDGYVLIRDLIILIFELSLLTNKVQLERKLLSNQFS